MWNKRDGRNLSNHKNQRYTKEYSGYIKMEYEKRTNHIDKRLT